MAEPFASTGDYVAPGVETARRRLPVRLLAVVFVIAALAGLDRIVGHSPGRARRVRIAAVTPDPPVPPPHGWAAAAISARSGSQSPTTAASTTSTTARAPTRAPVPASVSGYGCRAALAWLSTHAAPGFRILCPGNAYGHQAMTCVDVAGMCPGQRIIAVADPCPAAYMNEAHNSWVLTGMVNGRLDPYGWCG